MIDKKTFLKIVTVLYDTREQRNEHILSGLNALGVRAERQKLDYGDYSFRTSTKDFSMSCVIERKANVDELYQNTMYDPDRIEKEFRAGTTLANQFTLMVEGVASFEELRSYEITLEEAKRLGRKKLDIGKFVSDKLASYQSGSRYGFRTVYVLDPADSYAVLLNEFYYYWRNYCEMISARR